MRLRSRSPLAGLLAAAAATVLAAAPAQAQVLYWTDSDIGASTLPSAMSLLQAMQPGLTVTAATSQSDFNTQLASGSFQLAIFGEQGNGVFPGSSAALGSFLAGGGSIVGASWLPTTAGFFGAAVTGANFASLSGEGALFAGTDGTVGTSNPGWGVYAQSYSTAETCLATASDGGCAAVLGNGGRTLLLGPLFDSYASTPEGAQFVANGANLLLGGGATVTPEPATVALLGTGMLVLAGVGARRRRRGADAA